MNIDKSMTVNIGEMLQICEGLIEGVFTQSTLDEIGVEKMYSMADGITLVFSAVYGRAVGMDSRNDPDEIERLYDYVRDHMVTAVTAHILLDGLSQ